MHSHSHFDFRTKSLSLLKCPFVESNPVKGNCWWENSNKSQYYAIHERDLMLYKWIATKWNETKCIIFIDALRKSVSDFIFTRYANVSQNKMNAMTNGHEIDEYCRDGIDRTLHTRPRRMHSSMVSSQLRVKFNSHSQQICSYTDAFPIEFECVIDAKGATSKWFDSKWVEPLLLLHFQWISKPSQMHKYNQWKSITKYIFDSCNSTEISSYFACNQFFPP